MFFRYVPANAAYRQALRAAIASHRPAALRILFASHGETAFAAAIADFSGRVIADALSMLPVQDRQGVIRRLPRAAKERLAAVHRGDVSLLHRAASALMDSSRAI